MHEDAKKVALRYAEALSGPTETINPVPLFTDDIRHEIRGKTPISGVRNGVDAMVKYWSSLKDNYAFMTTTVHEAVALEDGRVFLRMQSVNEPRGEGKRYDQTSWYIFTVEGDKISSIIKCYEDTASMMEQWN
jgi:ketosteroid isomerase-like protein